MHRDHGADLPIGKAHLAKRLADLFPFPTLQRVPSLDAIDEVDREESKNEHVFAIIAPTYDMHTIAFVMARHPKDPAEAVDELGVGTGTTVVAVGPDHGFVEALAGAVGKDGKVVVQAPPPELEKSATVEIVDEVPADAKAETVIAWTSVVPVHSARALGEHVSDDGAFWLVLPKVGRDDRAPVSEGDLTRAMLSSGWKEERRQALSSDSFAVAFRRRR